MKTFFIAALPLLLAACSGSGSEPVPADTAGSDTPINTVAQGNALAPIDRSPMDMTYFPVDFPIRKTSGETSGVPYARVIYSRPHRSGRTIFGQLVPYGQPWRLGANEATEIELFAPARIQNQTVPKGRYILYCIPQPSQWTVVFNANLYTWGLDPDSTKDIARFTIPVQKIRPLEDFTMVFAPAGKNAELVIAWEASEARLPIQF